MVPPVIPIVVIPIPIAISVAMVIPVAVVAVHAIEVVAIPRAHKVPASRHPIAAAVIARNPFISRSRAWRNIGHRSADIHSELGRLG
jgi:PIN domain nuclease of toxin-antitoxin system